MRTLAEVDRRLAGSVPWRAVLAGDGPQRTAVEWARRRHGLDDVVALPGRLEHPAVVDLLAEADLYVAPALLESFGIAALEARCSGVPVVAVRGTGVGEFVQDGVTGRLVNDPNQLADAVTELLSDRAQLTTLSAAGADDLSQAWPRIVERCGQLYDVAARRRSTTHPPSSAMR
jgi:glycosyltransferase involved in cell wall biosynthesis